MGPGLGSASNKQEMIKFFTSDNAVVTKCCTEFLKTSELWSPVSQLIINNKIICRLRARGIHNWSNESMSLLFVPLGRVCTGLYHILRHLVRGIRDVKITVTTCCNLMAQHSVLACLHSYSQYSSKLFIWKSAGLT